MQYDLTSDNLILSSSLPQGQTAVVHLSPSARARLTILLDADSDEKRAFFRIQVDSGGCSGFQYMFSIEHTLTPQDIFFESENIRVAIDDVSINLINGILIDYEESLMGAAFSLKNPNAATACGCGNSFSL